MIEIVREFIVNHGDGGNFELAYGPGGVWSEIFTRSPGFRGTTLLRDEKNPRRYLTIDLWDSEAHRSRWIAEHEAEYAVLEASFARWSESIDERGTFRVLAEGTVRPRGNRRRGRR
jgi:hypothetical protein